MSEWWHTSLLLSCYGFFKEYRPSEPYISPFLTGPWKNFTDEQVTQEIYPTGIYFSLSLLVVVFLLTDYLRYKPVLITGGFAGIVTWTLLILGKTIPVMQVLEFFYGLFMASEVAYYTYIYAKVDKEHFQKVTSHTRTAFLLGRAGSGLSSQLFVNFNLLDYLELNYLTVSALCITTVVSLLLPSVPQSLYFHRYKLPDDASNQDSENASAQCVDSGITDFKKHDEKQQPKSKLRIAFHYLYEDFKEAYTNSYVLQWSIWWALATCSYLQIATYCQLLWEEINRNEHQELYNGFVEFAYSLLGAATAFGIGYLQLQWQKWGELVLGVLTLVQGACVFYAAYLTDLYVAYTLHIIYGLLYQAAITVASSEVAKHIREDSYALIFGINTVMAYVYQTVLTAIVVSFLKLDIRTQFQVYGSLLFITGVMYFIVSLVMFKMRRR